MPFTYECIALFLLLVIAYFHQYNISLLLCFIMTNGLFPPSADRMRSFNLPEGKVFTDNRIIFGFFLFVLKTKNFPNDQQTKDHAQ